MEDGTVVNIRDPEYVAELILPIDTMGTLTHKQDLKKPLGPLVVQTFLTDLLAGV